MGHDARALVSDAMHGGGLSGAGAVTSNAVAVMSSAGTVMSRAG